jgi:hypothetical protein
MADESSKEERRAEALAMLAARLNAIHAEMKPIFEAIDRMDGGGRRGPDVLLRKDAEARKRRPEDRYKTGPTPWDPEE